ncbi:MAG: hypothetical protein LBN03_02820 [Bifidobacteriaceae bacterium]|jgi:hypothetical protein|nr:hypothetical protein [Bifidobacteriaceae bacterium]
MVLDSIDIINQNKSLAHKYVPDFEKLIIIFDKSINGFIIGQGTRRSILISQLKPAEVEWLKTIFTSGDNDVKRKEAYIKPARKKKLLNQINIIAKQFLSQTNNINYKINTSIFIDVLDNSLDEFFLNIKNIKIYSIFTFDNSLVTINDIGNLYKNEDLDKRKVDVLNEKMLFDSSDSIEGHIYKSQFIYVNDLVALEKYKMTGNLYAITISKLKYNFDLIFNLYNFNIPIFPVLILANDVLINPLITSKKFTSNNLKALYNDNDKNILNGSYDNKSFNVKNKLSTILLEYLYYISINKTDSTFNKQIIINDRSLQHSVEIIDYDLFATDDLDLDEFCIKG